MSGEFFFYCSLNRFFFPFCWKLIAIYSMSIEVENLEGRLNTPQADRIVCLSERQTVHLQPVLTHILLLHWYRLSIHTSTGLEMHLQILRHKGNKEKTGTMQLSWDSTRMKGYYLGVSVGILPWSYTVEGIMGCGCICNHFCTGFRSRKLFLSCKFPFSLNGVRVTKEKRKLICLRRRSLKRHYMEICCTFAAEVV